MYYSKSTGGFYSPVDSPSWPTDAVEITPDQYAALLAGEAGGERISPDPSGYPVLIGPSPSPPPTREKIEAARLRAYAEPLTGSDRYFAEAQREAMLGNTEAADAARALGMARFAEIQAEYPWPAE